MGFLLIVWGTSALPCKKIKEKMSLVCETVCMPISADNENGISIMAHILSFLADRNDDIDTFFHTGKK